MKRLLTTVIIVCTLSVCAKAQIIPTTFGKGLQLIGKDSSYYMKLGFRFQGLYSGEWKIQDGSYRDYKGSLFTRRSRIKINGWALNPKLTYKFELALSNRDLYGGQRPEFRNTANLVLDAYFTYNFYKNFSVRFGQGKLPGNRERVISSANLQLVDRSILNSRFNIDRDFALQLKHFFKFGESFFVKKTFAFSQGEGRNVTEGHLGGFSYTFHVEFLPFGKFKSKGDYSGGDLKREPKPKLAVAIAYNLNKNTVRERGQLGSFIQDDQGAYFGRDLNTIFIDLMYKHNGFSVMAEYVDKQAADNDPFVFDQSNNLIGTFFTGSGLNLQAGYLFPNNWELSGRYTTIDPDEGVSSDENQYTFGFSKYIVGHKLKVQNDFTLREIDGSDNRFIWRTQVEFHF